MLRSPPVSGSRQPIWQPGFRHLEFETDHPVVRIHPETGEPSLLLGHFVRLFTGLSSSDSHDLFTVLQRNVTRLENTVRWRLHRVTVAGAIPVGIRGDISVPRKGDASGYSDVAPV